MGDQYFLGAMMKTLKLDSPHTKDLPDSFIGSHAYTKVYKVNFNILMGGEMVRWERVVDYCLLVL